MIKSNCMTAYSIIDQLVLQGVTHFCIAPGGRSIPLAIAAAEHPQAKTHIHYDERGLGFFALGISKATQIPTAIIVTSGTAVGNLLPSVMEADHSRTPLILLTADRPPELRDCGANQTTDQVKIFSSFVRFFINLPCEGSDAYFRSSVSQGMFYTLADKPGPVHINCPFREPLYSEELLRTTGKKQRQVWPVKEADPLHSPHSKGVILIGRCPDVQAILELAQRLQWPVCADILSNARNFPSQEQIRYYDWFDKPNPEVVLHFGERLTSKKIYEWLKIREGEYIHVSPWAELEDPERIVTTRVQSDIIPFCKRFSAEKNSEWLRMWKGLDHAPFIDPEGPLTEVKALMEIAKILPRDFAVFLGNGMPIRDANHFLFPEKCGGFFANRGLSGIDGNIATIAGLAEAMPILGFVGDQATLHDLNSLVLLKKTKHPVILIVSNNFGGGMFHYLPVAKSQHFEEFMAGAHALRFEMAAKMFDIPYCTYEALSHQFTKRETSLIELITDRYVNHQHRPSNTFSMSRTIAAQSAG